MIPWSKGSRFRTQRLARQFHCVPLGLGAMYCFLLRLLNLPLLDAMASPIAAPYLRHCWPGGGCRESLTLSMKCFMVLLGFAGRAAVASQWRHCSDPIALSVSAASLFGRPVPSCPSRVMSKHRTCDSHGVLLCVLFYPAFLHPLYGLGSR